MIKDEIMNGLLTPIKECIPYIEVRVNRTGRTFLIDWSEEISKMIE